MPDENRPNPEHEPQRDPARPNPQTPPAATKRKRMTPLRFETSPLPFGSASISTLIETLLLKARSGEWDAATCDAYAACLLESAGEFGLAELEERILDGFLTAPLAVAGPHRKAG